MSVSRHLLIRALEAGPWSTLADLAALLPECSAAAIYAALYRERRAGRVVTRRCREDRLGGSRSVLCYRLVKEAEHRLAGRVLDALADGETHTTRELAAVARAPYDAVDQVLRVVLLRRGAVVRERRGKRRQGVGRWDYRIADASRVAT